MSLYHKIKSPKVKGWVINEGGLVGCHWLHFTHNGRSWSFRAWLFGFSFGFGYQAYW